MYWKVAAVYVCMYTVFYIMEPRTPGFPGIAHMMYSTAHS